MSEELIPLKKPPQKKGTLFPGAYELIHNESGKIYIGSARDLASRRNEHLSRLRNGEHHVKEMQELFKEDKDVDFNYYPTETREQAYDIEQLLLDKNKDNNNLLNFHINSRNPEGVKHSDETKNKMADKKTGSKLSDETKNKIREAHIGRTVSSEGKENMSKAKKIQFSIPANKEKLLSLSMATAKSITIDGIEYESLREASRQLGRARGTIKKMKD